MTEESPDQRIGRLRNDAEEAKALLDNMYIQAFIDQGMADLVEGLKKLDIGGVKYEEYVAIHSKIKILSTFKQWLYEFVNRYNDEFRLVQVDNQRQSSD